MSALILGATCLLVGGGLIALLVVLVVASARKARERREGLAGYAAAREWTYLPTDPRLSSRFAGSPFGHGSSQRATNVIHGTHGPRPFTAFDYSYVTTSSSSDGGTSSTTHSYSIVAMALGVLVPSLSVAPQGGFGRFMGKLFGNDILIGNPAFDDAFAVSADDPRFATDVLHPAMVAMLMQWPHLAWRLSGDSLLLIRSGSHLPAEIDSKLMVMDAIIAQIPPHVWTNLQATGPSPE